MLLRVLLYVFVGYWAAVTNILRLSVDLLLDLRSLLKAEQF